MYTKISHGTNFMGAALYDAEGLSNTQKAQKAGKVELLETSNLLSIDAPGIAQEMQKVASYSRSQKPVWNISMSAPEGVRLTAEQWQQAAAENLRVMGVEPDRHQYAIYRHSDTQQDHIHILLNSVPVDGGPAVSRLYKAAKAKLAAPQIDRLVGIISHKGEGILDEIGRKLVTALTHRATDPDELKSDLAQAGVTAHYAQNVKGIYGITFQLIDRDHKPVKGSHLLIDGEKAKWSMLAAILEANRAEYQAEIEQLRQERNEAEKSREREERARKQAEQERDQARNQAPQVEIQEKVKEVVKPDPADKARIEQLEREKQVINCAKAEAEKARQIEEKARKQAEQERDQARNKPTKVEIQSNPADKAQIEELKKENHDLKNQLKLSNHLRTIAGVETTPEQRSSLLAGQSIRLNGLKGKNGLHDVHVTIEVTIEGSSTIAKPVFERIRSYDFVNPQAVSVPAIPQAATIQKSPSPKPATVSEQPVTTQKSPLPKVAPTQKPLPEPPTLDTSVVETMRQIMIKAAKNSKTWDVFSATLRAEGVKRQKLESGKFTYAYKNVQATAAELGFKSGEIKTLIEQRSQKIGR